MTESEYYGEYPSEENVITDVNELRKVIRTEFLLDLELAATTVSALPADWQVDVLLSIMEDI